MEQKTTHRNHYVPRFYLKNWSMDGNTIHTYSILVSNSKVPFIGHSSQLELLLYGMIFIHD